mmetsp:Transcript_34146/g.73798  ORF Transcript_34146/g.73798 Transcript_34146/m.73798 type:complete len:689 (-) Transcript_34146:8-2074(-)
MKAASFNGCKVYNLSSGKTMPDWLSAAKKRALVKDEEYRKRVELIQDFEMSTASHCIRMTGDGQHIIVTGSYPPLVRCYTTSDLALKFQRGMSCQIVAMETLSDDYGKLVFLQADRTLNFHAPYGTHHSIRVPKFGRDLLYNWNNCDLYVAASGDEVYRLNLEAGQFREPFQLSFSGCNKMHQSANHQLLAFGGEGGICDFWDPRTRKAVSRMNTSTIGVSSSGIVPDITAVKFDTDGLTLGLGTHDGRCLFYDIRSSRPVHVKEHQYGLPIVDITYHSSRHIITTDKKLVKIWERDDPEMNKILTNIEAPADINDMIVVSDQRGQSGLIMMAGEQSRVMTYFVPQLGPAPRWCSFLESLTEELEETAGQTVYDDFKFLTMKEIEELGATGLLGTPMLKGYMHGFFMEMKLYSKLRAVSKPFEYEEHRKRKIREKIDAKRESRIAPVRRLPKVNSALAEKMLRKDGLVDKKEKKGGKEKEPLIDQRFARLFEAEDFQQDEEAEEYKLRNPTASTGRRGGNDDSDDELADLYEPVEGLGRAKEEEDDDEDEDEDDEDDDDEEEEQMEEDYEDAWDGGEVGGFECYIEAEEDPENAEAAEVYRPEKDKGAEDAETSLLSVSPCNNTLNLVLRDEGVMKFIKYVSANAPGGRWDVTAEFELDISDSSDEEEGDDEDEDEDSDEEEEEEEES